MFSIENKFDEEYKNYVHEEFFGKSGKEHYRLLSYFSTLYSNVNIVDIGTHMGNSSLALSFNPSNTIHTFDIINKNIDPLIRNRKNIVFHIDNILQNPEYNELLLSCPFIFLDIDPHNGVMEYEFYLYLKSIGYKGFLICDDIWYFKGMRDHFWLKIDSDIKYDLTEYGHFSGTGIILFDLQNEFILDLLKPLKFNNSNWTLVTAYFNLTKCIDASKEIKERHMNYYLENSIYTLCCPYHLVIYCDEESYPFISAIRPPGKNTKYIIKDFEEIRLDSDERTYKEYRQQIISNRQKNPYYFDNRNTASYYLFCMSRYHMLKEVIKENPFQSTHFGWINFCIERMGYTNLIQLDKALSIKRDKFSTCYIDYISPEIVFDTKEYFKWGRCSMCSGFFTGNSEYMYKVCDLIEKKFLYYLEEGYGHADEQLYSPVYFENPDLFEHYYGDYQQMITNYVQIYENPEAPIQNFIRNSFLQKNYKKCYEACQFVLRSKYNIESDLLKIIYSELQKVI